MKKQPRKNAADATLRNVRASQRRNAMFSKRLTVLENRMHAVEHRLGSIDQTLTDTLSLSGRSR